jgi:hypothetical protein
MVPVFELEKYMLPIFELEKYMVPVFQLENYMVPVFEFTTGTDGCKVIPLGAIFVCTSWNLE